MARGARPVLPRPCHMRPVVPACGVPAGAKRPWCPPERAAKLRRARPYQSRRVVPIWPVPGGPSARGANLARARESGLVVQRAASPSPGRPTTRATDAACAALTWARLFGVVVRFHFSSSRRRSAADAHRWAVLCRLSAAHVVCARSVAVPARRTHARHGPWCPARSAAPVPHAARRARLRRARWGGTPVVPARAMGMAAACAPVPHAARGARLRRARWGEAPVVPARTVPARAASAVKQTASRSPVRPTPACNRRCVRSRPPRRAFSASSCAARSCAHDGAARLTPTVGRSTPIAFVRPVEWYTNPIRLCPTSRMLYESDSHLPPIRRMGESDS